MSTTENKSSENGSVMNLGNALGDAGKVHDNCDQKFDTLTMPSPQEHSKVAWEKVRQDVYEQLWDGKTFIDTEKWAAERLCKELCEEGYTAIVTVWCTLEIEPLTE